MNVDKLHENGISMSLVVVGVVLFRKKMFFLELGSLAELTKTKFFRFLSSQDDAGLAISQIARPRQIKFWRFT